MANTAASCNPSLIAWSYHGGNDFFSTTRTTATMSKSKVKKNGELGSDFIRGMEALRNGTEEKATEALQQFDMHNLVKKQPSKALEVLTAIGEIIRTGFASEEKVMSTAFIESAVDTILIFQPTSLLPSVLGPGFFSFKMVDPNALAQVRYHVLEVYVKAKKETTKEIDWWLYHAEFGQPAHIFIILAQYCKSLPGSKAVSTVLAHSLQMAANDMTPLAYDLFTDWNVFNFITEVVHHLLEAPNGSYVDQVIEDLFISLSCFIVPWKVALCRKPRNSVYIEAEKEMCKMLCGSLSSLNQPLFHKATPEASRIFSELLVVSVLRILRNLLCNSRRMSRICVELHSLGASILKILQMDVGGMKWSKRETVAVTCGVLQNTCRKQVKLHSKLLTDTSKKGLAHSLQALAQKHIACEGLIRPLLGTFINLCSSQVGRVALNKAQIPQLVTGTIYPRYSNNSRVCELVCGSLWGMCTTEVTIEISSWIHVTTDVLRVDRLSQECTRRAIGALILFIILYPDCRKVVNDKLPKEAFKKLVNKHSLSYFRGDVWMLAELLNPP